MATRLLLDVDTGVDDALAILYAAAAPELDLLAVTGVSGNVGLDRVMINSTRVLDAAGLDGVAVAAGSASTLDGRGPRTASAHGPDGLGGVDLPTSTRAQDPAGAIGVLRRCLEEAISPPIIAALAPQTNLARLLTAYPGLAGRIGRIVFVGGALDRDREPEFNVGHDPEAARIVLEANVPMTMYGIEVFERISVPPAQVEALRASVHRPARLAGELLEARRGRLIGDAGALVLLTNPELFDVEPRPLQLGTARADRGRTLIGTGGRAVDVVLDVQPDAVAARFVQVISDGFAD